jgi:hypothetical protein
MREQWAGNLRVAVIAGVIVVHTATAYVVESPGITTLSRLPRRPPATWPSSPPSATTPGPWPPTPTLAAGAPERSGTADSPSDSTLSSPRLR